MTVKELEQEILRQESIIDEEQRCLNFCLSNPDECDDGEIKEREEYIGKLIENLENTKKQLNNGICPLCNGKGEYSIGGAVQTVRCSCNVN